MAHILETVAREIIDAVKADKLVLPTLPEVALKVREVAEDVESTVGDLAKVIGNDAALSARVIKVTNSPLFRTHNEINSLEHAVGRLGIEYTCNLATGLAMEQMFQATSDVVDSRMRQVWARSTEVAAISHVLTAHYSKLRPDQATLAGLVHQIGILPILVFAEDNHHLLNNSKLLDTIIEKLHPKLGDLILKTWDFPKELIHIPTRHLDYSRNSDQLDYADIVMVANLQSSVDSEHPLTDIPWSDIPAFAKLGLDTDAEVLEGEDIMEEIDIAKGLLS
jgi:HD-like signal output (HDOD) protein